jgi:hypothetical protein
LAPVEAAIVQESMEGVQIVISLGADAEQRLLQLIGACDAIDAGKAHSVISIPS